MLLPIALTVVGLALLVWGSNVVMDRGAVLATAMGLRPMVVGLTIVSIGTSAPELAVGITAAVQGNGTLAVGNIAGTNLVNLLLILGLSAAISPLPLQLVSLKLDLPMMAFSAVLLVLLALDGHLSQLEGAALVALAVVYTVVLLRVSKREPPAVQEEFAQAFGEQRPVRRGRTLGWLLFGLVVVVGGAQVMVRGVVDLARLLGVSDAIIGLTVVAIGTSAPELVSTLLGTLRGERDIAVGNLLGSSTYNILLILGLTCLIAPGGVRFDDPSLYIDLGLSAGVALLCVPVFLTQRRVSRAEGVLFVSLYVLYLSSLLWLRT